MLSLKEEYTLRFLSTLIVDLFNSSANSWFYVFSLLIAAPELLAAADFLSKNL